MSARGVSSLEAMRDSAIVVSSRARLDGGYCGCRIGLASKQDEPSVMFCEEVSFCLFSRRRRSESYETNPNLTH